LRGIKTKGSMIDKCGGQKLDEGRSCGGPSNTRGGVRKFTWGETFMFKRWQREWVWSREMATCVVKLFGRFSKCETADNEGVRKR